MSERIITIAFLTPFLAAIQQDKEERKLNDNLLKFLRTTVTSDIEHL